MAFPVMNVYTSIRDENKENNPVNLVLKRYEKIRDILGTCTVMSDGKLKKGSTSDLIIERAYFDICDDPNRIYWKDEKNFFGADFYFCDNSSVIIGSPLIKGEKIVDYVTKMRLYSTPIFSLNGLYKKNNIRDFIGFFRKKKNVDGKINFLEDFCTKQDKSGFTPKDMVVKNSKLKLKLLEQHYKNFMEDYACYF